MFCHRWWKFTLEWFKPIQLWHPMPSVHIRWRGWDSVSHETNLLWVQWCYTLTVFSVGFTPTKSVACVDVDVAEWRWGPLTNSKALEVESMQHLNWLHGEQMYQRQTSQGPYAPLVSVLLWVNQKLIIWNVLVAN